VLYHTHKPAGGVESPAIPALPYFAEPGVDSFDVSGPFDASIAAAEKLLKEAESAVTAYWNLHHYDRDPEAMAPLVKAESDARDKVNKAIETRKEVLDKLAALDRIMAEARNLSICQQIFDEARKLDQEPGRTSGDATEKLSSFAGNILSSRKDILCDLVLGIYESRKNRKGRENG
jgi:hypothetical protein